MGKIDIILMMHEAGIGDKPLIFTNIASKGFVKIQGLQEKFSGAWINTISSGVSIASEESNGVKISSCKMAGTSLMEQIQELLFVLFVAWKYNSNICSGPTHLFVEQGRYNFFGPGNSDIIQAKQIPTVSSLEKRAP